MSDTDRHEMRVERQYPSGASEWFCPECGRRVVMQLEPRYRKVVLVPGDELARHAGATGGLRIGMQARADEYALPSIGSTELH